MLSRAMLQFSTQSNFGWKAVGVALEISNCGITIGSLKVVLKLVSKITAHFYYSGKPVSIDIPLSSSQVLLDRK